MLFEVEYTGPGVYEIRHSSGCYYVGYAKKARSRVRRHLRRLIREVHPNRRLQRLFDTGVGTWSACILEQNPEDPVSAEERWIQSREGELLNTVHVVFPSTDNIPIEYRRAVSDYHRNRYENMTEEERQRLSDISRRGWITRKARLNQNPSIRKQYTEEQKTRQRERQRKRYDDRITRLEAGEELRGSRLREDMS